MGINQKELAKAIGRSIARQRRRRELTQEDVAEKLQIGLEAVSRMERGIVVPTIIRLAELAQIFECELSELLQEVSPRPQEQAMRLTLLLDQLDTSDRQWVLETLEGLIQRLVR
ncbi:transcriptional regulator [Plesiomonas shigelloides]|uniref:helix-turn-helix domain-containing protein n=1 Tax=Plesiomonas shigelloides TaxID=703 RepID=UPI000D13CA40|nr:helix-turn-helix transcriptional regulator [Plesiomonas shigelloides]AVQ86882.1 transcriptional regulator [Plesiomonas shigelloides]